MKAIVNESIPEKVTSLIGVPSWMLVLLPSLKKNGKSNIPCGLAWMQMFSIYGGVSFKPYKKLYEKLIPKIIFDIMKFIMHLKIFGIQDKNNSDELLLMLDYGIFYEFIPFNGYDEDSNKIIPLSKAIDINYAMVITTNAGLWRYNASDTIRFTCLSPYRNGVSRTCQKTFYKQSQEELYNWIMLKKFEKVHS